MGKAKKRNGIRDEDRKWMDKGGERKRMEKKEVRKEKWKTK